MHMYLKKIVQELLLPNGFFTKLLLTDSHRKEGMMEGTRGKKERKLVEGDRGF